MFEHRDRPANERQRLADHRVFLRGRRGVHHALQDAVQFDPRRRRGGERLEAERLTQPCFQLTAGRESSLERVAPERWPKILVLAERGDGPALIFVSQERQPSRDEPDLEIGGDMVAIEAGVTDFEVDLDPFLPAVVIPVQGAWSLAGGQGWSYFPARNSRRLPSGGLPASVFGQERAIPSPAQILESNVGSRPPSRAVAAVVPWARRTRAHTPFSIEWGFTRTPRCRPNVTFGQSTVEGDDVPIWPNCRHCNGH